MLTSAQIRAARAMLRWDQAHLADAASVSVETIKRIERLDGDLDSTKAGTLKALRLAFEQAGIEFLNDGRPGVRSKFHQPPAMFVEVRNRLYSEDPWGVTSEAIVVALEEIVKREPARADEANQTIEYAKQHKGDAWLVASDKLGLAISALHAVVDRSSLGEKLKGWGRGVSLNVTKTDSGIECRDRHGEVLGYVHLRPDASLDLKPEIGNTAFKARVTPMELGKWLSAVVSDYDQRGPETGPRE